jgi:hypothetical protein
MIDRSADALVRPCDNLDRPTCPQHFVVRAMTLGESRLSTGVDGSAFSTLAASASAEEVSEAQIAGAVLEPRDAKIAAVLRARNSRLAREAMSLSWRSCENLVVAHSRPCR